MSAHSMWCNIHWKTGCVEHYSGLKSEKCIKYETFKDADCMESVSLKRLGYYSYIWCW